MLVDLSRPVWKPSLASCAILPLFVKSPSYSGVGEDSLTIGSHSYADFMTYFGAFSLKNGVYIRESMISLRYWCLNPVLRCISL